MSRKVLVVDDEKLIVKGIRFSLEQDGMEVDCAYHGEEALKMATENHYDMILLDIMLPKMDGFQVCQHIREFSNMPIIMLTAKGEDMDKILGLEYGADDYITKPFGMMEFIARVRAVLRRAGKEEKENDVLETGDLQIQVKQHQVLAKGEKVTLTLKEFELLKFLMENKGIVLTRDRLLGHVWGYDFDGETRTVDVHIRTLRQKLGEQGSLVKTVRGVGYRIGGEA